MITRRTDATGKSQIRLFADLSLLWALNTRVSLSGQANVRFARYSGRLRVCSLS